MRLGTWLLRITLTAVVGLAVALPASAGLVHRYTFEEGNANDSVGSLHGAVSGATIDNLAAKEGSHSAEFDGDDDYIGFGDTAFNDTAFSVAMWVKLDGLSTYHGLLANKEAAGNPGFSMYVTTAGQLAAEAVSQSGASDGASTDTGVMDSLAWRHIAYTFDVTGSQVHIYLDGVDKTTDSDIQSDFPRDVAWRLGLFMDDSNDFDGRIDNVCIYNQVLGAHHVEYLYEHPGAPEPATLLLLGGGGVLLIFLRKRRP